MRDRAMGVLFILSGLCFLAGVINPPLLSTWGESVPEALRTASAHRRAFRGALPFPQFLAFIALGITALMRPSTPASPAPSPGSSQLAAQD